MIDFYSLAHKYNFNGKTLCYVKPYAGDILRDRKTEEFDKTNHDLTEDWLKGCLLKFYSLMFLFKPFLEMSFPCLILWIHWNIPIVPVIGFILFLI